jgi:hypothetical protein
VEIVVECECGWTLGGEEDRVIEAAQVHMRQIHGREVTCEQVLGLARPT